MKPELKDQWISALESGEYSKTEGHLRDEDGFCALGVLADLAVQQGLGKWVDHEDGTFYLDTGERIKGYGSLTTPLRRDWAGLTEDEESEVFDFNDDILFEMTKEGMGRYPTFHEVAIWIKENV